MLDSTLSFFRQHRQWILPVVLFALIAPWTPGIDLATSGYFYEADSGFSSAEGFQMVYRYGILPSWICAAVAGVLYLLSLSRSKKWHRWKRPALVLIYTFAIGSGLIVNGILKEYWGRPRPKQCVEFAGKYPFRAFYEPDFFAVDRGNEHLRSFPSGHVSTGAYFLALVLVGRRLRSKRLMWLGGALTVVLSIALSLTRVAQGGHFFSDCIAACVIMWLIALACDYVVHRD